jgi:hypothetical protein
MESEYQESFEKVSAMLKLFEREFNSDSEAKVKQL